MYFPSQELQPHVHDIDEAFVITAGAVDIWIWEDAAGPPTHLRRKVGDSFGVPANTVHALRADRVEGLTFHETVGDGAFAKRATEFQDPLRYKMPSVYAGKTVLVTGANRGLGLGFAEAFTAAGANVVACCRDPAKAESLNALSPAPVVLTLDISSEESIASLPDQLQKHGVSSLDYVINNAGISVPNHPNDPIVRRPRLSCVRLWR